MRDVYEDRMKGKTLVLTRSKVAGNLPETGARLETGGDHGLSATVVVCTRNRGKKVVPTIQSVLENRGIGFELLLIDQSTNDEAALAVEQFTADPRFRYLRSNTVGTGRSRNIGLSEARAKVVVYTDDDCSVPVDWVRKMVEIFDNEHIGMAFSNVLPAAHDERAGFIPTYIIRSDFLATSIVHKLRACGIGASMAVRREAALNIGGFDEMLGPGAEFPANEEGDLAVRMLLNGWHVYETNHVAIIHDGFRTWEQGKELAKRNWTGVGAAYAKPIKLVKWRFLIVVMYEGFVRMIWSMLASILRGRKPQGFRGLYYFWYGFSRGLQKPVDPVRILFLQDEHADTQGYHA